MRTYVFFVHAINRDISTTILMSLSDLRHSVLFRPFAVTLCLPSSLCLAFHPPSDWTSSLSQPLVPPLTHYTSRSLSSLNSTHLNSTQLTLSTHLNSTQLTLTIHSPTDLPKTHLHFSPQNARQGRRVTAVVVDGWSARSPDSGSGSDSDSTTRLPAVGGGPSNTFHW